eukprot:gene23087-30281_t
MAAKPSPSYDCKELLFHEIEATLVDDPVTGKKALLVIQHDITNQIAHGVAMKRVLDVEHRLLEQMFPRHVLAAFVAGMFRSSSRQSLIAHGVAMKRVLDVEHRLLDQMFPRHVLAAFVAGMSRSS